MAAVRPTVAGILRRLDGAARYTEAWCARAGDTFVCYFFPDTGSIGFGELGVHHFEVRCTASTDPYRDPVERSWELVHPEDVERLREAFDAFHPRVTHADGGAWAGPKVYQSWRWRGPVVGSHGRRARRHWSEPYDDMF